jgi:hypothetical protein
LSGAQCCRDFFEANVENNDICKDLQKLPIETQLAWEGESASIHSPGPIDNSEELIRYWLNPIHYDSVKRELKPTAFDEATRFGASINRLNHISHSEVKGIAQARVDSWNADRGEKPAREVIGYSTFKASEVREIFSGPDSRRALAAYDTALTDDKSHGDVCQIATDAQGGKSARYFLRELTNRRLKNFD